MQGQTVHNFHDANNGIFPNDDVLIEFIKHIYKETCATQNEDSPVEAFLHSLDLQKAWMNLSQMVTCIELNDSDTNGLYLLQYYERNNNACGNGHMFISNKSQSSICVNCQQYKNKMKK